MPKIYLLSPTPREGTEPLPMIEFSLIAPSIDFGGSDTLMFTSKQAVKSAEAIDPSWKNYPSVAIGGATKKQIEALGGRVIYHPEHFYGKSLAEDIIRFFSDRKLLYLRPKEVSFDSKGYLEKAGIVLREQVIYETACRKYGWQMRPEAGSIIIFTSPSTIRCFLKNFGWDSSYKAVVIGEATKAHLPPEAETYVADRALIDACVEKAREVLITSNSK